MLHLILIAICFHIQADTLHLIFLLVWRLNILKFLYKSKSRREILMLLESCWRCPEGKCVTNSLASYKDSLDTKIVDCTKMIRCHIPSCRFQHTCPSYVENMNMYFWTVAYILFPSPCPYTHYNKKCTSIIYQYMKQQERSQQNPTHLWNT